MPVLTPDPNRELPTYPPRARQPRSSSTSTNDSGVVITPTTSPNLSIVDADRSPFAPLSAERSHSSALNSHAISISNDESSQEFAKSVPSSSSLPTVMKSQPILAPSLFSFPIEDDDTLCDPTSESSLERKLTDPLLSESTSRSGSRPVSRGRSIKRSAKWASPPGSASCEKSPKQGFSVPLEESSYRSVSPITTSCPPLVAPEPSTSAPSSLSSPLLSSPLCSLSLPELSKATPTSPPPLIFEPTPCPTLPPPPPPFSAPSVITTLSPRTIFHGLGYRQTGPSLPNIMPRSNALHFQQRSSGSARSTEASQTTEASTSSRYYFADGNVVFQVRGKLYKVHRYFFEQNSLAMTVMISSVLERAVFMTKESALVNIANFPVLLPDTDPVDFERLLSIFYPRDYSQHDAQTVEDWTSILRVSSRFGMAKLRSLALDNLYMTANAVEKIALNNEFHFDDAEIEDEWVLDAYVELVTRVEPLTLQEGEKLGMKDVIRIQAMKTALVKDLRKYLDMERVRAMIEAYL